MGNKHIALKALLAAAFCLFALDCRGGQTQDPLLLARNIYPSEWNNPQLASTDMAKVQMQMSGSYGETSFAIPKAYLASLGSNQWRPGAHKNIYIETALPDMVPWTAYGLGLLTKIRPGSANDQLSDSKQLRNEFDDAFFKDWISINAYYGHCQGVTKSKPRFIKKFTTPDSGYRDAVFKRYLINGTEGTMRYFYVPIDQDLYATYIECPELGIGPQRCIAFTSYDSLVSYQYYFSILHLHSYQVINQKINSLLSRFVTKSSESSAMPAQCK